jgi:hypothetical protein
MKGNRMGIRNYTKSIIVGCSVALVVVILTALNGRSMRRSLAEARAEIAAGRLQVLMELAGARAEAKQLQTALEGFRIVSRDRYGSDDLSALERLAAEMGVPQGRGSGDGPASERVPAKVVRKNPKPTENPLQLAQVNVGVVSEGLVATLQFNPTTDEPLDVFALVVRLPRESSARILALDAVDAARYRDIAKRISDDGKFAVFNAEPLTVKPLTLQLHVSEPVRADVRGTSGIEPFELMIEPVFDASAP